MSGFLKMTILNYKFDAYLKFFQNYKIEIFLYILTRISTS